MFQQRGNRGRAQIGQGFAERLVGDAGQGPWAGMQRQNPPGELKIQMFFGKKYFRVFLAKWKMWGLCQNTTSILYTYKVEQRFWR